MRLPWRREPSWRSSCNLTELRGAGDLRLYIMVQFYTLALILLMLWLFPARYTRGADLLVAVGFYVLAKIFESADRLIYSLGHIISGHTLKHVAAVVGVYWIFRMVAGRDAVSGHSPSAQV